MDIQQGINYVLAGEGLLFIGSGFSLGATNLRNTQIKTGNMLANSLSELAGIPTGKSLEDSSECFLDRFGADALIGRVGDAH